MEDKKIFGLTPEELDRLSGNREPAVDPQYKMKPINPGETLEPCIRGAQKILDDPEKKAMMERIYRGQPKKRRKIMSNLPKGEVLNNRSQLQNVVTGIILRQTDFFSKEEILIQVNNWCDGSDYSISGAKRGEVDVEKMIEETLNTLWSILAVKYNAEENKYKLSLSFPSI